MVPENNSRLAIRRYSTEERAEALLYDIKNKVSKEFISPLRTEIKKTERSRDSKNKIEYWYDVYVTLK